MGNIITEDAILYDSGDSLERNKKEKEYLDYIIDHINKVKECYQMYMVPLLDKDISSDIISAEELKNTIKELEVTINTHDASKFSDSEFDGYRAKYYPTQKELNGDQEYNDKVDLDYEEAWKHHYETNVHHPEHWLNHETGIPEDMSLGAIIEMICDWEAMSLKFGTSVQEWYENSAVDEKRALSSKSKEIVDWLLNSVLHN